jgi:hypothetical protein
MSRHTVDIDRDQAFVWFDLKRNGFANEWCAIRTNVKIQANNDEIFTASEKCCFWRFLLYLKVMMTMKKNKKNVACNES